jgi:L-lactate dehydrogenase complex protein LldG
VSARDNILARIRRNSGHSGLTTELELSRVRTHIARQQRGPQPSIALDNPVGRFIQESDRLKSTVAEVDGLADIPQAVAVYLKQNRLENHVVGWPSLAELSWTASGITYENRLACGGDMVGITDCFCGIGETGTLVLLSSPSTPKLHALLPETHLCVLSKSRIVHTLEDAFQLVRTERGELPRAAFFVSGPSRTADIEQTIVIGAHGPYRVHIILTP